MLESTKWKKYKLSRPDVEKVKREDLEHWTLVYYNPDTDSNQLVGVITEVKKNYLVFLGDPAVVEGQRFREGSLSSLVEELQE